MARPISTYSIVACDLDQGSGASPCSRSSSPSGRSSRGPSPRSARSRRRRTRTRATAPTGSRCCGRDSSAEEVVKRLTEADDGRDERQLGVVDAAGRGATFTGSGCHDWAGGRTGLRLRRPGEHPRLRRDGRRARGDVRGDRGLAGRATAGEPRGGSGGRRRQPRPAIGVAARRRAGRRLRRAVGRGRRPSRRRSRDADRGAAPPVSSSTTSSSARRRATQWLPVDDELRAEIDERLAKLGYERLEDWAGAANLEERVDGDEEIDPVVLRELRRSE